MTKTVADASACRCLRVRLEGVVQGVGFRPFVHELATRLGLAGYVSNSAEGVLIEIEGVTETVNSFVSELRSTLPPLARIDDLRMQELTLQGWDSFAIRESTNGTDATALIPPDSATCSDCLQEIRDPANRRYRYPFTNCTHCGPRFSIVTSLPYDRPRTTMGGFAMCEACAAEYGDSNDRRFHAQPVACPDCGPRLTLSDTKGTRLAERDEALLYAAQALRDGHIVALKGIGGFQLAVDARRAESVSELRIRKRRPDKPFAIMFASLESSEQHLDAGRLERELLLSREAPIVLIRRRDTPLGNTRPLCDEIAPNNPDVGAMLPYSPLHHLLLAELGFPLVMTSGNITDEPMIVENDEALEELGGVADFFLTHNRPIANAVDDSVLRVVAGRELMIRRARGYAPAAIDIGRELPPLIALGGHMKTTIAAGVGGRLVVGPHIGDLVSERARNAWDSSLRHLNDLHPGTRTAAVCDKHPDYYTSQAVRTFGAPVVRVQHHVAHVAGCMAENRVEGPALGVVWDGTGYGEDGTVWGGEFILINGTDARRVAHLRSFRLPGGEVAVREPRRSALGVLFELFRQDAPEVEHLLMTEDFSDAERRLFPQILSKGAHAPATSSMGRLFDAAAYFAGLVRRTTFEGQAGMALEHAIGSANDEQRFPFSVTRKDDPESPLVLDWGPAIQSILTSVREGRPVAQIAAGFHNGLVRAIVEIAQQIGEPRVVLTGGCFQNRYLTEHAIAALRAAGFQPLWHRFLPPNDGGLAVGQAAWACRILQQETESCA